MLYRAVPLLATLLLSLAAWADAGGLPWRKQPDYLEAEQVFRLEAVAQQDGANVVASHVAPGYYVYRQSLRLVDAQGRELALALPAGTVHEDAFFGKTQVYTGSTAVLRFAATASGPLSLHWQGCADAGICYPPQTIAVNVPAAPAAQSPVPSPEPAAARPGLAAAPPLAQDQATAHRLATLGPVAGSLLFFGLGLLLAFTPCMLPMVPIVSAMVVGQQARPRRALGLSLVYVLSMALTYAAVGVAAGLAGANLQAALQSPVLLGAFAALFVVLAASLFGCFSLRMPSWLADRIDAAGRGRFSGGGTVGAAALGLLSALLVGPCMTAPLAGALLYIGQTGSAVYGGTVLFALGLGMGLPLLAIAAFGARVLPRPGAWMDRVRVAFGYAMLAMAVLMLERFVPKALGLALWGGWALVAAVGVLAWAQALQGRTQLAWGLRSVAALSAAWALLVLVGAASGGQSLLQPLAHLQPGQAPAGSSKPAYVQAKTVEDVDARIAQAAQRGQWTLIDFYADWCVSCHVIEREVFGDAAVRARLDRLQLLRPDVTRNDAQDQALLRHWGVLGPPTLVLVGPDGQERRALRMVGELGAQDFLQRLDAAGTP